MTSFLQVRKKGIFKTALSIRTGIGGISWLCEDLMGGIRYEKGEMGPTHPPILGEG